MIIKNGLVFNDAFRFEKTEVYTNNGIFVAERGEAADDEIIDAEGLRVIPGLVDVHTHGSFGHDFCDADREGLKVIAEYLYKNGITAFCPTSMTLGFDRLKSIFATAKNGFGEGCADIIGINMEGPFIAESKKGAQEAQYIKAPDYDFFKELNEGCGGIIRLVTVAPEADGAAEFIAAVKDTVNVSLGHTEADYETAAAAFAAGADHVTHLYNAMPPFTHRAPGVIGAAYDAKDCMAELICDGIHIHPSAVRAAFKLFGAERIVLISDSTMATGMENGEYTLGGQKIFVQDGRATLSDGTIAGSATNLYECMKKAISFGISPEAAIRAASANPAQSIGMYDSVGSISAGKRAHMLLVDDNYELVRVLG